MHVCLRACKYLRVEACVLMEPLHMWQRYTSTDRRFLPPFIEHEDPIGIQMTQLVSSMCYKVFEHVDKYFWSMQDDIV